MNTVGPADSEEFDEVIVSINKDWSFAPLKYVSEINPDSVSGNEPDDWNIEYIDISSVSSKGEVENTEPMSFGEAPSRAQRLVEDGDTIVSTVRTYLKAIAHIETPPSNLVVSTGFGVIRPDESLHPRYLWRVLQAEPFVEWIVANSEGVSYPAIKPSRLGDIIIPIPSLKEQKTISSFLDRHIAQIDELIEKKNQLINLLNEKRTALVSHTVAKGLRSEVDYKLTDVDWFEEIPAGWEIVKLKRVTSKIGSGVTPDGGSKSYVDSGVIFLRSQNITFKGLDLEDVAHIDEETDEEMASTRVKPGDILLNITGASIGRCSLVPRDFSPANVNQHVCIIRPKGRTVDSSFLNYVISSNNVQHQIFAQQMGASREAVTFSQIGSFHIPLPPISEQREIAKFLDDKTAKIESTITAVDKGIELLEEKRQAIITNTIVGDLDISELDAPEKYEVST